MKKTEFVCPHCRGYLSVGDRVVFTIRKQGWTGGLLLLSPVVGDYQYENHWSYKIQPGEEFDFICPICHSNLSVPGTEKFAKVIMREEDDGRTHEFYVVFSRVEGEKCTFKIAEKQVESFGESAHKYVDFVNASLLK